MKTAIQSKSDNKTPINQVVTTNGRSGNVSASRLRIEEFFENATKPHTRAEIAKACGVHENTAGHVINDLLMKGIVWNLTQARNRVSEYILSSKRDKKPVEREQRYVPTEVYRWSYAAPARAGAADHEDIPSRRPDGLVKHQPMMLMASKVKGGESAR